MKQSVEWHKDCLANMWGTHDRLERQRDEINRKIARLKEDCERRSAQIDRAVREGKDGFDDEIAKFYVNAGEFVFNNAAIADIEDGEINGIKTMCKKLHREKIKNWDTIKNNLPGEFKTPISFYDFNFDNKCYLKEMISGDRQTGLIEITDSGDDTSINAICDDMWKKS